MKFGSELEEGLVPEWRTKYFDYKGAKKQLKSVAQAIRKVEPTIENGGAIRSPLTSLRDGPVQSYLQRRERQRNLDSSPQENQSAVRLTRSRSEAYTTPIAVPVNERSPLRDASRQDGTRPTQQLRRYGSIIGSPPTSEHEAELQRAPTLELPVPAIDLPEDEDNDNNSVDDYDRPVSPGTEERERHGRLPVPPPTQLAHRGNAYQISKPTDVKDSPVDRPFVRRFTSFATPQMNRHTRADRPNDVALEAYRELDFRKAQFFAFLDKELAKIESFYKAREHDANERLKVLKEQLHILRDRRLVEIEAAERRHRASSHGVNGETQSRPVSKDLRDSEDVIAERHRRSHPFHTSVDVARDVLTKAKPGHVGKTSQAMGTLASPKLFDPRSDYERHDAHAVPYRVAKRKLKIAFAELYRGLELLKSYSMMNRTAFRKITKKFDKLIFSTEGKDYNKEKVGQAYFVQSDGVEVIIQSVEDLYSRYFERGNRKIAVGKLRQKTIKEGAFYGPTIRTGILIGVGAFFAIEGLVYGAQELLEVPNPVIHTQTSYLLQLYAGYFLLLLLFALFCTNAAIFTTYRVNYPFIFEFDTRHMLNWKQLCEPPAWFLFILGLTIWLNFSAWSPQVMFIYWPVILIGVSAIILCLPLPFFYWRSRSWLMFSNFRLLLAGAYPVEFRDFFLGDMLCSQTYALGNIELFFCLYSHNWNNPPQCNSNHSMLLGFFSTVPGIMRLLQCFRRYYDSRLWTHLLNGAKYTCTILQYMSLSLWRIYRGDGYLAFFIVSAVCNSVFCSFWDLNYDWSMPFLNPYSKPYPFLREVLAYKKHVWWYYLAMVIDPILRFNWIFYVIFKDDIQHSSLVSFFIAFSEVLRRGMWVLFRVENEHCANVSQSKALRDPTLPFQVRREESEDLAQLSSDGAPSRTSAVDVETGTPSTLRRRVTETDTESPMFKALKRAGTTLRAAHAMDYERKRRPEDDGDARKDEEDESDSE